MNTADIPVAELGSYLERHVAGFERIGNVRKFKTGQSNPTYLIEAESGNYVLRAKPAGKLLKSAHQVDREFRVMKALQQTKVPVPKVFHLADEESPLGRTFFVMEYLDGRIFWDPALPEITGPSERAAIYDAMNIALAALHDVDAVAVGLTDFGKPGSYFERQFSRWQSQYRSSETGRNDDMDNLIQWLESNMIADDGQVSLVHGDYRIDNMIFDPTKPEILAILDWELSTLGHPYADLAYQCMQWRLPHDSGFRGLGGLDRESLGLPGETAYVESYCRRRGISRIPHWKFYIAFSFFRLAAILQGVYKRSLDGTASNPELARRTGQAVPVLTRLAMEAIEEEA